MVWMPPIPMMGVFTACDTCQTIRIRQRLDRRPAETADPISQDWLAAFPVDRQALKRVDQRECIRPGFAGGDRNFRHAGHIGSEFGDDRKLTVATHFANDFRGQFGIGAVVDATADVRAGDVEFEGGDAVEGVESLGHRDKLCGAFARNVHDQRRSQLP